MDNSLQLDLSELKYLLKCVLQAKGRKEDNRRKQGTLKAKHIEMKRRILDEIEARLTLKLRMCLNELESKEKSAFDETQISKNRGHGPSNVSQSNAKSICKTTSSSQES